jgi:hypothetical protein
VKANEDRKTLRDKFAMAADMSNINDSVTPAEAAAFLGVDVPDEHDHLATAKLHAAMIARVRYIYADAMLTERDAK